MKTPNDQIIKIVFATSKGSKITFTQDIDADSSLADVADQIGVFAGTLRGVFWEVERSHLPSMMVCASCYFVSQTSECCPKCGSKDKLEEDEQQTNFPSPSEDAD